MELDQIEQHQTVQVLWGIFKVGKLAEKQQLKFFGVNQLEAVETLVDSRISKIQKKKLYRNPVQIRSSYLTRLGIPPSPQVTVIRSPFQNNKGKNYSPAIPMRVVQNKYKSQDI